MPTVAGVLVQHEWSSGLNLSGQDGVPQFLSLDGFAGTTFPLILLVEFFEFLSPDFMEARGFVGTEQ